MTRRVLRLIAALLTIPSATHAQTTTTRTDRLAASTRVVIGSSTFGTTSPLQVVGLPTRASGESVGFVDGSGNVFKGTLADADVPDNLTLGTVSGTPSFTGATTFASTVGITGVATFGANAIPSAGYQGNVGLLTQKWLTGNFAELWVGTLVAQQTMATIGGRLLVGPTTTLTSDVATPSTAIVVKHNSLANGDRIYLEANGAVEFMAVTSGPSGSGPYTYTVTRNLDGTGANAWTAGDAVFNTGQTGSGFIDLYSVRGVKAGTEFGPTIVGNVRVSSTYNDWAPRWAIGNLDGLYGYSSTTFGSAFGPANDAHVTVDATNGVRMRDGSTTLSQWATDGTITIGALASNNTGQVRLDSDSLDFLWRDNGGSTTAVLSINNSGGSGYLTSTIPVQVNANILTTNNLINPTAGTFTLTASNTGADVHLKPGVGGYVAVESATDFRPTTDSAVVLGTDAFRWDNINLDLPNNASPAYVVVNKGGGGGDTNSALGYVIGTSATVSVAQGDYIGSCTLTLTVGLITGASCPEGGIAPWEPADADLTAIAALTGTGIPARTAADTWALRTLTAGAAIAVTNGTGAGGNPTIALDVPSLTADASPDGAADYVVTYDASATAHKKVLINNLPSSGGVTIATAALDFSDGDTLKRFTVADAGVSGSSKVALWGIRRPDTADDTEDRGHVFLANVVRIGSGSFDVLVQVADEPDLDPPSGTVTLYYVVQ